MYEVNCDHGIESFVSSSVVAGALADAYGNYNIAFYYAGGVLILAGIMTLPLTRLSKWERNHKSTLRDLTEDSIRKDTTMVTCISLNVNTSM